MLNEMCEERKKDRENNRWHTVNPPNVVSHCTYTLTQNLDSETQERQREEEKR